MKIIFSLTDQEKKKIKKSISRRTREKNEGKTFTYTKKTINGLKFLQFRDSGGLVRDFCNPKKGESIEKVSLSTLKIWTKKYQELGLNGYILYLENSESIFKKYHEDIIKLIKEGDIWQWTNLYKKLMRRFAYLETSTTSRGLEAYCKRSGIELCPIGKSIMKDAIRIRHNRKHKKEENLELSKC